MVRLSSTIVPITKRLFPIVWVGGLVLMALFTVLEFREGVQLTDLLVFYSVLALMALAGYIMMRKFFSGLVDQVYDEGSTLLFRTRHGETRVHLHDIKNVNYEVLVNPQRVTISLRTPSELGTELSFSPTTGLMPMKRNPAIDDLIDRIDQARRQG